MGYTTTNPQFGFSLYSTLFTYDNTSRVLLDLDRNWTQVWDIMAKLNPGGSIGFNDNAGIYRRPIKKRQAVTSIIATTTQQGANLVLTFADINYSAFRVKDYVKDDNMYEGRVIVAAPGTVTIEPMFNPLATFVAATHFVAGQSIRAYGDVSGNFNSAGVVPLYRTIDVQSDYSTVYRDTCQRARREKIKTHIGTDGVAYFYTDDETDMVKRAMKNYGKTIMFGEPGTKQSPVEGQINMTRGIRRSIITDGFYNPGAGQITRAQFEDLYYGVAATDGSDEQSLEVWMGRRAAARIQSFYQAFIQYGGSLNTFGGATVKGTNIMMNASAGVTTHWRILGALNDTLTGEIPDWMQDSVYIIDTTPVTGRNENGQIVTQSPLQKIHWSANTNTEDEIIYKCVPGMTQPGLSNDTAAVYANYQIAASANDGYSCEYLHDFGLSYVADRSGLFEYIH